MTAASLRKYVEDHIPIVKANGLVITSVDGLEVTAEGVYKQHLNHRNSVFGGSISSILILVSWAKVRVLTDTFDPGAIIVVQTANLEFKKPVLKNFSGITESNSPKEIEKFKRTYARYGKARLQVKAFLKADGTEDRLADFTGEYVVTRDKR